MTIGRGRHGEDSNNRILLKRWMATEMRWKRKADSLSSAETDEMHDASSKSVDEINSWTVQGTKVLYCIWLKAVIIINSKVLLLSKVL